MKLNAIALGCSVIARSPCRRLNPAFRELTYTLLRLNCAVQANANNYRRIAEKCERGDESGALLSLWADHSARRRPDGCHRSFAARHVLHVLDQVPEAVDQALATCFRDLVLENGIGGEKVGRREHVQHLPCGEFHHVFMMF